MREKQNDIECNEKTSNEFVVYREKFKNCKAESKNMKEERDKLAADLKLLRQANQDKEKLKIRSEKLSEVLKSQQLTNENLRNEMSTMNHEIIKSNAALKSLQETNKALENKTWNMVDSFDDIYRYIQEAKQNIVGKKKYFGKCFTSNRFLLDHLQSIEDITNIYE